VGGFRVGVEPAAHFRAAAYPARPRSWSAQPRLNSDARGPETGHTGRHRIDEGPRVAYPCSKDRLSLLGMTDRRAPVQGLDGVALAWRKAKGCAGASACVEVAVLPEDGAAIRDGKDPRGTQLHFGAAEWAAFLTAVKNGEFDAGEPGRG
jgi:hypothetical protein